MQVSKVLSNNAVLATTDEGHEVVALGRGVGFGLRPGARIDGTRVEQVFMPEDTETERLTQYLADVPLECIRAAGRIAALAEQRLQLRRSQAVILPLADHLAFAARRQREGIVVEFPLRWEVGHLYPGELAVAREGLQIARDVMQADLPDDEAVPIAMHLVNAQFAGPGMSTAMQMTETIGRAFTLVSGTFGISIDPEAMGAARFVTHLRYVVARIASGKQIHEPDTSLYDAIAALHPEAMACAAKLRLLIEMAFSAPLTAAETAYLALHVARLVADDRAVSVARG